MEYRQQDRIFQEGRISLKGEEIRRSKRKGAGTKSFQASGGGRMARCPLAVFPSVLRTA